MEFISFFHIVLTIHHSSTQGKESWKNLLERMFQNLGFINEYSDIVDEAVIQRIIGLCMYGKPEKMRMNSLMSIISKMVCYLVKGMISVKVI